MVAIAPFRALRYHLDLVGDLSRVVAPPYDVISPEEREALYAASPYNVVRLIAGKPLPTDSPLDNRYTRAQQTFGQWRREQRLIRDEVPAIYLYEHVFPWPAHPAVPRGDGATEGPHEAAGLRRLGFVALLALDEAVPERVWFHEATLEEPKADRLRLLEAVRANLSPIFCLVPDPSQTLQALLNQWRDGRKPVVTVRVPPDEEVRIWAMTEPDLIHQLQREVAPRHVLIADGHHRFAVAWSMRQRFGAMMSYFSLLEDPAVLVRPIHRVVHGLSDAWTSRLRALCHLAPASSLDEVTQWLARSQGEGQFGYYEAGRFSQVRLRQEALDEWLARPSVPQALAHLDVAILHGLLIPQPPVQEKTTLLVHYAVDPAQAIAMVEAKAGDCAWLLRSMPVAQVFALARQGLTLPPKSTYFYPKLLSGLLINPFE